MILARALEIDSGAERDAFLDRACDGNAERRREVDELVAASAKARGFMDHPAIVSVSDSEAGHSDDSNGAAIPIDERIGPYKLVRELGAGGMGTVYLAEQTEALKRQVAIKVIKLGMDSAQVVARFEAERQALAMMDHPNIAKVFDAGTTRSGRPYFVMEYVEGQPFNAYCDDQKVPLRARLRFFVQICHAIHHAHQKGVIHRDIKPSNVLMTMRDGKPVPKVIDFGVAKAMNQKLTESTLATQAGAIIGTLQYMSPEQADMNALGVDARSDIYSMGVMLYGLLTGTTPLERHRIKETAFFDLLRSIREEEAPRPSARMTSHAYLLNQVAAKRGADSPVKLMRQVRGELDWIAMRALEKNRARRYESAYALARDVEHYLNNEPVEACPPSKWYQFKKLASRNKSAFVAGGIVALVLMASSALSTWFALKSIEAENKQRQMAFEAIVKNAATDDERGDVEKVIGALEPYLSNSAMAEHALFPTAAKMRNKALEEVKHAEGFYAQLLTGNKTVALDLGDGSTMEFILIPAGEFTMGSPENGRGDETQHPVQISKPFYMGTVTVTQKQYEAVTGKTPSIFKDRKENPVETVTWLDAKEFCEKLKRQSGPLKIGYQLPTEAQWEYACRAGTQTTYYTGNKPEDLARAGWYENGSLESPQPVRRKAPNAFGLYDMHGNVKQWCEDWYSKNYYVTGPRVDPTGPPQPEIDRIFKRGLRVLRGGAYSNNPEHARAARRHANPEVYCGGNIGFRVVVTIPEGNVEKF